MENTKHHANKTIMRQNMSIEELEDDLIREQRRFMTWIKEEIVRPLKDQRVEPMAHLRRAPAGEEYKLVDQSFCYYCRLYIEHDDNICRFHNYCSYCKEKHMNIWHETVIIEKLYGDSKDDR